MPTQRRAGNGAAGDEPAEADHTPERALQRTVEEGERRLGRSLAPMVATGLVGGIDVGTGVFALLLVERDTHSVLLGGLAFSIGFIALLLARSELFTENFLVPVAAVVARRANLLQLGKLWGIAAASNLVGGWVLTGLVMTAYSDLDRPALAVGNKYAAYGFGWHAFALGLLGGLVITLMTWMQHSTESIGAKLVAAVTAAFLLAAGSLNHAIVASLLMFAALHTGHASFGYLHWFLEFLYASVANVVGGVGLVTLLRLLQVPHRLAAEREAHA